LFCKRSPPEIKMSKEHIWSDWLRQVLPPIKGRFEGFTANIGTQPHTWQNHEGHVRTKRVRVVCRVCNERWMSAIVQNAKPYAKKLITGEAFSLDEKGQQTIASWVGLSALMANQITKSKFKLPASDVDHFFQHHKPPSHWFIGLGQYVGDPVLAFNHAPLRMGFEDVRDGSQSTTLVKHAFATIIGNLFTIVDVVTDCNLPFGPPPNGPAYVPMPPCRHASRVNVAGSPSWSRSARIRRAMLMLSHLMAPPG
jgi:hypothetical protein